MNTFDQQHRDLLIKALSSGFYALGTSGIAYPAWSMGTLPSALPPGKRIRQTLVINHTDSELDLIEALVGRTTPFIPEEY